MLKMLLNIEIGIFYLQKSFIRNKSITYSEFNFYWPRQLKNKAQVLIAIKKELINKIIIDNRTNLVNHFYFLTLNI